MLLGTGAWLFGLSQRIASEADGAGGVRSARFSGFLALAFLLATLAMLPGLTRTPEGARQAAGEPGWQDFPTPAWHRCARRSGRCWWT